MPIHASSCAIERSAGIRTRHSKLERQSPMSGVPSGPGRQATSCRPRTLLLCVVVQRISWWPLRCAELTGREAHPAQGRGMTGESALGRTSIRAGSVDTRTSCRRQRREAPSGRSYMTDDFHGSMSGRCRQQMRARERPCHFRAPRTHYSCSCLAYMFQTSRERSDAATRLQWPSRRLHGKCKT